MSEPHPDSPLDPRRVLDRLEAAALQDARLANTFLEDDGIDPDQVAADGRALLERLQVASAGHPMAVALSPSERIDQVAGRLNWHAGAAHTRNARPLQTDGAVASTGYYHDQPIALFVAGEGDLDSLVTEAADRAYQASIPWGLAVTPRETAVFNSHWYASGEWYRVTGEAAERLADGFTPERIADLAVEQEARRLQPFDGHVLVPIDRRLVEQLDAWRRDALAQADGVDQMRAWDGAIQGLFAKLFIVRTVEDMKLAKHLRPVSDALGSGEPVNDALRTYFARAKEVIESDLFDDERYATLPGDVVERIVRELYVPADFPADGFRYDFSWVRSDVLGQAYEQYLARVLSPVEDGPKQTELWGNVRSQLAETSVRQDRGVYYTPDYLVRHLCRQAFEVLDTSGTAHPLPRVADFSCGSGSFLRGAVDLLLRRLNETDPDANWGHEIVDQRLVVGIDTDERAVEIACLNVYQRLVQEDKPLPLPRLRQCIVQGDALAPRTWEPLPAEYSVVVGNPPFLSTLRQNHSRADLRSRFKTARGRFDTSFLFVELALDKLSDGGALAMVVPNRVFGNRDAAALREVVAEQAELVAVEDFGSLEVFDRTSAYIGTLIARRTNQEGRDASFRFVRVTDLPDDASDEFLGVDLDRAVASGEDYSNDYVSAYTVRGQHQLAGGARWRFYSTAARIRRNKYEAVSEPFDDVCDARQGVWTGSNDSFVVTVVSGDPWTDHVVEIANGVGDQAPIEASLLRASTFGAEIERYSQFEPMGKYAPSRYLIYPLLGGTAMPEPVLRDRYPLAYEYLIRQRPVLASRRGVEAGTVNWFQLERPRPGSWLDAPKLLMRDLAPRPSFAVNEEGGVYIIGGTAVVPNDSDALLPLLGFLNSGLAEWALSSVTPEYQSGYRKVGPQHLRQIRIPRFVVTPNDGGDAREALADVVASRLELGANVELGDEAYDRALDLECQIDQIIYDQTGVDLSDI